jgi:hypothetical protein
MAKIFFAYPYAWDETEPQYRVALRQAVKNLGHECVIAKEIPTDLPLLEHIKLLIEEAEVAFFDITGLNPNVLIEFGIGYAADTRAILLENTSLQFSLQSSVFGAKKRAIEIPSDLKPFVRCPYTSTGDIAGIIAKATHTYLPEETAKTLMRNKIKQIVKASGPINMSGIASAARVSVDDVRPVLKGLIATQEVRRIGNGPGTRYQS